MKFFQLVFISFLFLWIYEGLASESPVEAKVHLNNNNSQKNAVPEQKTKKNYSWFFDSTLTKQELALVPVYFKNRTYGSNNWGLRLFTFSPDNTGYYGSFSILNQFLSSYFKVRSLYRRNYPRGWKIYFTAGYSNYFQPWYGEGMKTVLTDRKDLYAHQIFVEQKFLFKGYYPAFYEVGMSWIVRKEDLKKQKKRYFEDENFLFPEGTIGYDSRDSWANAKKGQYHQISLGCVLRRDSNCRTEGDFRFYFPVHDKISLALRGFAGMAFLNKLSYSLAYSLGGSKVFRGFTYNRFRGDKVYFAQGELRMDLWKEILSGVLFFEMGEVSALKDDLTKARWNYGGGLRFGIPPSYKVKFRADFGISDEKDYNITMDFHQSF